MSENELAKVVLDAAFQVHTNLGPGLLESVYEVVSLMKCGRPERRWSGKNQCQSFTMAFDSMKLSART